MNNLTDIEIRPFTPLEKYKSWVKKNYMLVIAIIIILGLVMWDINQYDDKCSDCDKQVELCNIHWREQCIIPTFNEPQFNMPIDINISQ